MSDQWATVKASAVEPGQRVRMPNGTELIASRIEPRFFGMDNMIAFIEDTGQRWFKQPVPTDTDVEVSEPQADL